MGISIRINGGLFTVFTVKNRAKKKTKPRGFKQLLLPDVQISIRINGGRFTVFTVKNRAKKKNNKKIKKYFSFEEKQSPGDSNNCCCQMFKSRSELTAVVHFSSAKSGNKKQIKKRTSIEPKKSKNTSALKKN